MTSPIFAPPELWTELIAGVIDFVDPLLRDQDGALSYWDAEQLRWAQGAASRRRSAR